MNALNRALDDEYVQKTCNLSELAGEVNRHAKVSSLAPVRVLPSTPD
jgi:hypothetical protein